MSRPGRPDWRRHWWWVLPALLGLYGFLPVAGQVILLPGRERPDLLVLPAGQAGHAVVLPGEGSRPTWPLMRVAPEAPAPGQVATLWVTDRLPWAHMRLTVDGRPARYEPPPIPSERRDGGLPTWTWEWTFSMPASGTGELIFYHDCDRGCVERGRLALGPELGGAGSDGGGDRAGGSSAGDGTEAGAPGGLETDADGRPSTGLRPTKLGLVFPHPDRNWHGRAGWAVELSYAREPDAPYWGIDDLAGRLHAHRAAGQRVLLRVDYDRRQSLPPQGNLIALREYLDYARRLAADARMAGVYAYFYGSGYNAADANGLAGDLPVTPEWYARVFNGAGVDPADDDNLVEVVRGVAPGARLLVGPMRPFVADRGGRRAWTVDAPWLSDFESLVVALEAGAAAKAALGRPGRPDGFALHLPGRPEAPELAGAAAADEPRLDWRRIDWSALDPALSRLAPEAGGARGGFAVYRDWLAIINAHPGTRGLPAYVTAANTYAPDAGTAPAEGYPEGWLTAAYETLLAEPQVEALCWFVDGIPGDTQWRDFQLTEPVGRSAAAAAELDALLEAR
ncbi:MAG: hypothetical protein H6648_01870 [Caldilineae bacterium]|nr:hypothetical protein [Chloroflexota bacterium]MCB9175878.1 hypothetical protein [Caldilineae bacterium]